MHRVSVFGISLVPAGVLLLPLASHRRYGFFLLLRWVVSIAATLLALIAHDQDAQPRMWVMVCILIVFNPFVPLHLRRETWRLLELGTATLFFVVALRLQPLRAEG